jgi:hypothetical protein
MLEAKLKAEFWSSVGFPAGSLWWEECSTTSATPATKNPALVATDLESTKIIIEPKDSAAALPNHRASKGSRGVSLESPCDRGAVPC